VLSVPFNDDEAIDWHSLEREVEFLATSPGISVLAIGFASEIIRLTDIELDQLIQRSVSAAGPRTAVVAAVRAGGTRAAAMRADTAASAGAQYIMAAPPPGCATDQSAIDFYGAVADASGLPVIVQDAPAASGVELPTARIALLVDALGDQVAAIKVEPMPSAPKISALRAAVPDDMTILGGAGGADFLNELQRGSNGTMPGAALPEIFTQVFDEHTLGDTKAAVRSFAALLPLITTSMRTPDTFIHVQKEILRRRAVFTSSRLRTPADTIDPHVDRELDELLSNELLARSLEPRGPS